jgi:dynein heavy chain
MGVEKHMSDVLRIAEAATKQYEIERSLERISREWDHVRLAVKPHRNTGTHVLSGEAVEEVQSKLDDHLVKIQTMRASPYAKDELFRAIRERELWLTNAQDLLEVWLKVQSAWVYLEPVFAFDDISKRLPGEGTLFKVVDTNWKKLMVEVCADLKVTSIVIIPHVKDVLEEARKLLVAIQFELNQYLNTKRTEFPRFYFLSNEEILEILSEAKGKSSLLVVARLSYVCVVLFLLPLTNCLFVCLRMSDVTRIQPHLKRCFEGVHQLVFRDNGDIEAMQSREGEVVKLSLLRDSGGAVGHSAPRGPINPSDSKGAVERWLKDVERAMKQTINDLSTQSLSAYTHVPRADWAADWPGQVVVAVNQIHWTASVSKGITKGKAGLAPIMEKMNLDFGMLVTRVGLLARGSVGQVVHPYFVFSCADEAAETDRVGARHSRFLDHPRCSQPRRGARAAEAGRDRSGRVRVDESLALLLGRQCHSCAHAAHQH